MLHLRRYVPVLSACLFVFLYLNLSQKEVRHATLRPKSDRLRPAHHAIPEFDSIPEVHPPQANIQPAVDKLGLQGTEKAEKPLPVGNDRPLIDDLTTTQLLEAASPSTFEQLGATSLTSTTTVQSTEAQTVSGDADALQTTLAAATSTRHISDDRRQKTASERYPASSTRQLPLGKPKPIPLIQYDFTARKTPSEAQEAENSKRIKAVQKAAAITWKGYKDYAWMHDEVRPESGSFGDPFGTWAATMVDSLDTLHLLGFEEEFEEAVRAVSTIDFTTYRNPPIPLFEVTIRYLGGLLGAYDISGARHKVLLDKAVELADFLLRAFDTPNRMPQTHWNPEATTDRSDHRNNLAELGTLSLEFTRLAQLTKEFRYYDAVARITDALADLQEKSSLPGLWPVWLDSNGCKLDQPASAYLKPEADDKTGESSVSPSSSTEDESARRPAKPVDGHVSPAIDNGDLSAPELDALSSPVRSRPKKAMPVEPKADRLDKRQMNFDTKDPKDFTDIKPQTCTPQDTIVASSQDPEQYTFGGRADSTYEYIPKQYVLLGGQVDEYRTMYTRAIDAATKNLLYRPMSTTNEDVRLLGNMNFDESAKAFFVAEASHLTCFAGGMYAYGAKLFNRPEDLEIGAKLTKGCIWAYNLFPTKIMPENMVLAACDTLSVCEWDETKITKVRDDLIARYSPKESQAPPQSEAAIVVQSAELKVEDAMRAEQKEGAKESVSHDNESINSGLHKREINYAGNDVDSGHKYSQQPEDDDVRVAKQKPAADSKTFKKTKPVSVQDAKPVKKVTQDSGEDGERPNKIKQDSVEEAKPFKKGQYLDAADAEDSIENGFAVKKTKQSPDEGAKPFEQSKHMDAVAEEDKGGHGEAVPAVEATEVEKAMPKEVVEVGGRSYLLRPEAIESIFYMYRITGDQHWREEGWKMFLAITKATPAKHGYSAIKDATTHGTPELDDKTESFWLAETLKYFYLLYADEDVLSLDEWVFNTEAHPFKRP